MSVSGPQMSSQGGAEKSSDLLNCTKEVCGRESKSPQPSHTPLQWSEIQDNFLPELDTFTIYSQGQKLTHRRTKYHVEN